MRTAATFLDSSIGDCLMQTFVGEVNAQAMRIMVTDANLADLDHVLKIFQKNLASRDGVINFARGLHLR